MAHPDWPSADELASRMNAAWQKDKEKVRRAMLLLPDIVRKAADRGETHARVSFGLIFPYDQPTKKRIENVVEETLPTYFANRVALAEDGSSQACYYVDGERPLKGHAASGWQSLVLDWPGPKEKGSKKRASTPSVGTGEMPKEKAPKTHVKLEK